MPREAPLDFVGVGAARCGTTWIARCLREHPSIFIPAQKELHYFNGPRYEPTLRLLRRRFAAAPRGVVRGEITPRYIINEAAMWRIREHGERVRIIVTLRDPVERAFSQYRYFRLNKKKEVEPDFVRAFRGRYREDYLVKSLYAPQLRRVFDLFDRRRVHVVLYDDIRDRPEHVLRLLFEFLDVAPSFLPAGRDRKVNSSRDARRHPPRPAWARLVGAVAAGRPAPLRLLRRVLAPVIASGNRLIDRLPVLGAREAEQVLDRPTRARLYERYFRDDVDEAERLLDRDLSGWKHQEHCPPSRGRGGELRAAG